MTMTMREEDVITTCAMISGLKKKQCCGSGSWKAK
jgi:hypothetical protein